ncbi:MAG: UDP-2,3-diacylglucosamine diphosphatase [Planctomycetaceae bacterium]|jgi:UDP-2,3-diacylglucosamine pyrophosphatase LpxH
MSSIRSIFVSDVHLGCRYTHADALLQFLRGHEPEHLYLVGDIIDGWRLRRGWYWTDTYTYLLRHIVGLMKRGTRVYYTPGNHDEFLRCYLHDLGSIQIADELVHHTADGRRLLVMHGDQFDTAVRHAPWLAHLGDTGYNLLLGMNIVFNGVRRRLGKEYWSLSAAIKRRVKQATSFVSNFETLITQHAADRGCAGVVCGHIHTPRISRREGVDYYNTGDWVESCTALVEHGDGTLELLHRPWHGRVREHSGVFRGARRPTGELANIREVLESGVSGPAPVSVGPGSAKELSPS